MKITQTHLTEAMFLAKEYVKTQIRKSGNKVCQFSRQAIEQAAAVYITRDPKWINKAIRTIDKSHQSRRNQNAPKRIKTG